MTALVSFVAIVPEVNPEMVFPVPPILISPTFTCVAESVPLIVAAEAVSPVDVSEFPEVPTVTPVLLTVVVPAVNEEAETVPDVVRQESVRVEAPVEKDSDVTPLPVT